QTTEQTCKGWGSRVVGANFGLKIVSTGGMVQHSGGRPYIYEIYWYGQPAQAPSASTPTTPSRRHHPHPPPHPPLPPSPLHPPATTTSSPPHRPCSANTTCFQLEHQPLSQADIYTTAGPTSQRWSYPDGVITLPLFCGFQWSGSDSGTDGSQNAYTLSGTITYESNPNQPHLFNGTVEVNYAPPPPPSPPPTPNPPPPPSPPPP
ncbi:hypothetical protein CYMTET_33501, partial [Cymbomonas tetramitiformis]